VHSARTESFLVGISKWNLITCILICQRIIAKQFFLTLSILIICALSKLKIENVLEGL
jgi:hypothetical protein